MYTNNDLKDFIRDTISVAIHDFSVKWKTLEEKEIGIENLTNSLFESLFEPEKEKKENYFLKEKGIQIMHSHYVEINERIFDEELFEYRIINREDFIEELTKWISEAKRDKQTMLDDLKMLMNRKDDYMFSSISTNDYIGQGDSNFDATCKELLELNEELKNSSGWKFKVLTEEEHLQWERIGINKSRLNGVVYNWRSRSTKDDKIYGWAGEDGTFIKE